jgi:hypothetical protein
MQEFKPREWDYFYVRLDVKSFQYLGEFGDPFPLLRAVGMQYMDKVMFDAICQRYTWEYTWISGYGFKEGFNYNIREVVQGLWKLRMELKAKGSPLQAVVKRMISSMFGKSITREKLTSNAVMGQDRLLNILNKRSKSHIFWFKKMRDGENYAVKFVNSIVMNWIRPQFGVNVLNWSRVSMQKEIDRAEAACAPVYYVNTDCMVMREGLINHLNVQLEGELIGPKLGQFDWELPMTATKFVCISRRSYMFRFTDGTYKVRFGPKDENPEEWFDAKFEQRKGE